MKPTYTHVPSEGPLDARVIILAESPWINEAEAGRPLWGMSGNLLKRWWGPLGIQRHEMRIMNLFPYKPPTREIDSVPAERLIKAIEGVHERLVKLIDPYVIVTMGNYATFALTGKGKVKASVRNAFGEITSDVTEAEKKAGITSLRGSIYPYKMKDGRVVKVVPMIHPAGVLQMAKWEKRSIKDWEKVKRESEYKEIRQPQRFHIIDPSDQQLDEFCHSVYDLGSNDKMSVDIETWGNVLSCVGFCVDPLKSVTIPLIGASRRLLPYVKWLCESAEIPKCGSNFQYDWYWLDAEDIDVRNYIFDCQYMHHALDPAESHSLDFLASIYCPHYVYWKDEAKEAEEIIKYAKNVEALWVYNGLDVCYTRELADILEVELHKEGMWDFYVQHYQMMYEPLVRSMRYGIRVDVEAQKKAAKELRGELKGLHEKLNRLAGEELFATEEKTKLREPTEEEWNRLIMQASFDRDSVPPAKAIDKEERKKMVEEGLTYMMSGKNAGKIRYKVVKLKKDFSKEKLLEFFYGTLKLPEQKKLRKNKGGKKKTVALDEDALRKLMRRFQRAVEPCGLLLQYREKKKELDYLKGCYDRDGRVRCEYTMRTNAGRLSSRKNPMKTGLNLQNIKR